MNKQFSKKINPRFRLLLWGVFLLIGLSGSVQAIEVGLAGLFPGKVLLTIAQGAPRIVAVGETTKEGIKVISVSGDIATLEVDGKKRTLRVGQNVKSQPSGSGSGQIVLTADSAGHFLTTGYINGISVPFLVDTGASLISLGANDARRMGIDPSKGQPGLAHTANGSVKVTKVKLDRVRIGDIELHNIDAMVMSHDMSPALLGMSFLNRMEIQRSAGSMRLKKLY